MECGIDDVVTTYSISNAFIAYSLDFPIMRSIACEIWRVLERSLATPYGLEALPPSSRGQPPGWPYGGF